MRELTFFSTEQINKAFVLKKILSLIICLFKKGKFRSLTGVICHCTYRSIKENWAIITPSECRTLSYFWNVFFLSIASIYAPHQVMIKRLISHSRLYKLMKMNQPAGTCGIPFHGATGMSWQIWQGYSKKTSHNERKRKCLSANLL